MAYAPPGAMGISKKDDQPGEHDWLLIHISLQQISELTTWILPQMWELVQVYTRSSSSWWSLGLEDDIICASDLWVREWLCRPILDLQSRAQSGHWKFAFVAGIQAAKWRRSLADCAWWRRSSSSADDADCESVRQHCLSRAVATSSVGGMSHHWMSQVYTHTHTYKGNSSGFLKAYMKAKNHQKVTFKEQNSGDSGRYPHPIPNVCQFCLGMLVFL